MRQWLVNPKLLCRKHLLGEHVESHMFVGTILKKKSLDGYFRNRLLEVHNLKRRHQELVQEMTARGYNHKSKLPYFRSWKEGYVDRKGNIKELTRRCKECGVRIQKEA